MQLKTKLTLSIAALVLLVVLAVNLIFLAGGLRQQLSEVYNHADFLSREIYNQMNQELAQANLTNLGTPAGAATLRTFVGQLRQSPAMGNLFSSAIGYNSAIRDVALVAPDGTVVMDSNPLLEGAALPQRLPMSEVMNAGLWTQVRAVFGPETIYAVGLGTQVGGQALATITVGVDTVLLRQAMLGRMRTLLLYGGLIVLLATGLAWSLADLALSPLAGISAQLDALSAAGGGSDQGDEFGRVRSKIQRLGREIEDTRQVYSALQENVSQVLGGLEEGLLLFDAQGQCVMASAALPRLLGLATGECAGRAVEEIFAGDSSLDRAVRQAVRLKQPLPARELERHAGGRPLLARLDMVPDGGGQTGALLMVRDAEPLNRLESELELARRLSAVGRLTRGVAHEVKNPLNAMSIHLQLLRAKAGGESPVLGPHIDVIGREIERLDRVVRTFLDFSRPVELKLVAADLSEVARQVVQLAQAGAEAGGMRLRLAAPDPGPRVWLDRDLVEQALLNLINNGLQAMDGAENGRSLHVEVLEQDLHGLIRVRDEGPGIAPEHRDKIFDLYFTTRAEGTGIGLALAARIMQMHHGSIELEPAAAAPGGASFLLRFPLRKGEVAGAE
ncbi:MAG TPA: ATP-binding protein [Terriglobales bacterium]|nr:ATP-binding protein [Terriglobales bacterium]